MGPGAPWPSYRRPISFNTKLEFTRCRMHNNTLHPTPFDPFEYAIIAPPFDFNISAFAFLISSYWSVPPYKGNPHITNLCFSALSTWNFVKKKKMPKKPWAISSWDPWIKKISLFHHHFWEAKLTLAHLKWGSAKQTQMLKCIAWLTHIWVVLGVSVGKYTIHCASGKMVHQDPKYDWRWEWG